MELIKYLPFFYSNSSEVSVIQISLNNENSKLQNAVKDLLNQLFVNSATWGLDYWENLLDLYTNRSEPIENRRARIKTRLRGQGTATKDVIKNVCMSFTNGEVEVIEDSLNYSITLKFVGTGGIPTNLDYLLKSIKTTIPAHLAIQFSFTYILLRELETFTLNRLEQTTLDSFAF